MNTIKTILELLNSIKHIDSGVLLKVLMMILLKGTPLGWTLIVLNKL
jgi:hypothetical protein